MFSQRNNPYCELLLSVGKNEINIKKMTTTEAVV